MTGITQHDEQVHERDDVGDARWSPARRWALIATAVVVVGAVAWLAFGWFGVQGLILDDEVDEAVPTFDSEAEAEAQPEPTDAPSSATESSPGSTPTTTAPAAPVIEVAATGDFVSIDHATTGRASVLTDGSSQRFLRLEGFATDNGPDLNVYLTTTPPDGEEATFDDDFVDLGDLQGNVGDQNYEIPAGVDLGRHATVVIWCVRFDSAFGAAPLV